MAYTSVTSNEIPAGTQYYSGKLPLGDYDFYLQFDATSGSPKVVTRCDSPDGIRAATQRTLPAGAQIFGWSVEANETEASVYAAVKKTKIQPNVPGTIYTYQSGTTHGHTEITSTSAPIVAGAVPHGDGFYEVEVSADAGASFEWIYINDDTGSSSGGSCVLSNRDSLSGLYYYSLYQDEHRSPTVPIYESISAMCESVGVPEVEDTLIARFHIDLGDAGGYPGGGGGWTQPGDWNPDPTTTLHLTVNGALSGRHNDPLEDPSYSYLPADNTAEAGYGCGGDGGHGGGGGGGASTVIAEQFATNKANNKVIVATAKRHGYGSGGSKGAKGGDGCILIYY